MAKRILIIDDEPPTVKLLTSRLKKEGYEVFAANDKKSGLKKAQQLQPDLIFLDVVMPGISGYEICKLLKSDENTKKSKIIVFTNKIEAIDALKARHAGADEFLPKLIDPSLLLETVKKMIA